jgi:hypothetical protein
MPYPAVWSNTFLAHRRGSESCAQPRCWWPRRRAKNALRYVLQHICAVLSRRIHAAGADRRRCLPEQGLDLRHPVQGIGRDADHHRGHPKHLGARIGLTSVLHTWGSALTAHSNVQRRPQCARPQWFNAAVSPTAPCSPAATPSNKAFYRVPASQTHRPLRSNPHSASRTPAVPSSRFPPLLEDFVRRPRRAPNRSQRPASEILHKRGGACCVS